MMKKVLSMVLCTLILAGIATGCRPKADPDTSGSAASSSAPGSSSAPSGSVSEPQGEDTRPEVNLTLLNGPTGVGAARLLFDNDAAQTANRYNVTIAAANDEVTAALLQGTTDIAALSTSVAANLAAKSDGAVEVLAVNTLGVLYILEKGDTVHALSDLAGKTVYATGQGANPEYILGYLLSKTNMDLAAVDIQWMTPQEVTAKMTTEENAICMLPVPAATALLAKDEGVRQAISLSQVWDTVSNQSLPMGCVVVRSDFAQENPQVVADFLREYQASIAFMAAPLNLELPTPDNPAQLAVDYGLIANVEIARAAIPNCILTFLSGEEMKQVLEPYYQILFQTNRASIGGMMPYDSFYYGVS